MNLKHIIRNISSSLKVKFGHRRVIHYSLLSSVIALQLSALLIWYNENANESKISKSLDSIDSLNKILHFTEKINNSFINTQLNFNTYKSNNGKISFNKYATSLKEINNLIDSLSLATKDNKEFIKILKLRNQSESNILILKSSIDSILENQINNLENNELTRFKLNKFEYKKILDSIKMESYLKVDSVAKKGFFSRIGDAVAGKIDVQKEQLNITVTMKYNNKLVSGSIEDQIENVFKTTNRYYEIQFKSLKKSFINLKKQDLELIRLNNQLLNLESTIIPVYTKSLSTLQDKYKLQLKDAFVSHKRARNYTIVILIFLMLIISVLLLSFTKLSFQYEKRLTFAYKKISQSLKFKNRIIGMISHEIRSPLSIIAIYSKMISSSVKNPEIQQTFKSIEFTTNSLVLLSSQILEYSKDENYSPKLKNKRFELKSELNQIIISMSSLVESKGNKIEYNSSLISNIEVNTDAVKIHQLFYNIIGNANKFTTDGLIIIDINHEIIAEKKLNLKIQIRDNGTGISEQDLKNIFELYYQGEISERVNDIGVGLGLNLCREIVNLYGGQINVESEDGYGTNIVFNIVLNLD